MESNEYTDEAFEVLDITEISDAELDDVVGGAGVMPAGTTTSPAP